MSRERFQKLCITLLKRMEFDIVTARSFGGDFEAEAELQKGDMIHEYVIRITRSGGDPEREVQSMRKIIAPGIKGLYITTESIDEPIEGVERIETVDCDDFYDLMKEYDILSNYFSKDIPDRTLPSASEVDRLMEWGDEFFKKNNYPRALEYYEKAIDHKPESVRPRLMKAEVLMNMGEQEEARDLLMDSIKEGIISPEIYTTLGKALHELGEFDQEIEAYDRALDINEDHIDAWRNKGATLYEQELYDEAELCFDRVLEVEPRDEGAWNNKGLCLYKKGELGEALHCINNALEIHPEHIESLLNKAMILENQGKMVAALRVIQKLIQLRPERPDFHYIMAAYLEALNEYEESYKSIERSLKLDPDSIRAKALKGRIEEKVEDIGEPLTVEEDSVSDEDRSDEKDKELQRLKEEKEKLEQEVSSIWEQRIEEEDLTEIELERDELKEALESKEEELQELVDLKDKLDVGETEELERLETEIKDKEREIEDLTEQRDTISEEVERFREEVNDLKDKRDKLTEEIDELQQHIVSEDIESIIQERESAMQELDMKERQIENLKVQQDQLLDDLARYRREEKKREEVKKESGKLVKQVDEKVKENDFTFNLRLNTLYKMGEYKRVLNEIGDNEDEELINLKGCCLHELGRLEDSEESFNRAKNSTLAKYNLEEILFNKGRFDEAVDISDEVMGDLKDSTVFWEKRAELMRRLDRYEDAILSYHKAGEVSKTTLFDVINAEAICRMAEDGIEETVKEIRNKDCSSRFMKFVLGTYLYLSRDYKKSNKLLRDSTGYPDALYFNNLGCVAYQTERFGESLSAFEKAVKMEKDVVYFNNLGFCQLERNLIEAAEESFATAVELDPNDASSWYHLGIAMKRLDKKDWREMVKQALELESDFEAAKRLMKT